MHLIAKYKKIILTLSFFSLISSSFLIISPYISKLFIDNAFLNKNLGEFFRLSVISAIIFIVSLLIRLANDIIKNKLSIKLKLKMANIFTKNFFAQDIGFFQSKSAGENAYRSGDIQGITGFITEECPGILTDIIRLAVILVISLWINLQMTLVLLILSPLFLLQNVFLQNKLKAVYEGLWKHSAELSKEIYETFSKILIIKAFGLENFKRRRYFKSLIQNIRWQIKSFRWFIITSLTRSFLSKAIYGAVTLYGGWLIIKGNTTLGSYTACMIYLTQIGALLQSLSSRFDSFARTSVSIDKFYEVTSLPPKINYKSDAKILDSLKGHYRFQDVWFGYSKPVPLFKGIDFQIPEKSWVSIAGPSGRGKTTLINLMLRLYDPCKGGISLDGTDLKNMNVSTLRKHIAIATQEPLLFDASIKENISYGLKGISHIDIEHSAQIACIDNFIKSLPEQYGTLTGENACKLSIGQKQRISIARAILRNPDILILDEATSSVDSKTEEEIFNNLKESRQNKTTIVISHRLFWIKDADMVYFIGDDNKIAAGTHKNLLAENPSYNAFFHNQI